MLVANGTISLSAMLIIHILSKFHAALFVFAGPSRSECWQGTDVFVMEKALRLESISVYLSTMIRASNIVYMPWNFTTRISITHASLPDAW